MSYIDEYFICFYCKNYIDDKDFTYVKHDYRNRMCGAGRLVCVDCVQNDYEDGEKNCPRCDEPTIRWMRSVMYKIPFRELVEITDDSGVVGTYEVGGENGEFRNGLFYPYYVAPPKYEHTASPPKYEHTASPPKYEHILRQDPFLERFIRRVNRYKKEIDELTIIINANSAKRDVITSEYKEEFGIIQSEYNRDSRTLVDEISKLEDEMKNVDKTDKMRLAFKLSTMRNEYKQLNIKHAEEISELEDGMKNVGKLGKMRLLLKLSTLRNTYKQLNIKHTEEIDRITLLFEKTRNDIDNETVSYINRRRRVSNQLRNFQEKNPDLL
jgi:hypothetical protein